MADATTTAPSPPPGTGRESEPPDIELILARAKRLLAQRAPVDALQQEIADYVIPRKAVIAGGIGWQSGARGEGQELGDKVWDSPRASRARSPRPRSGGSA
jgi:hypothetical protein